MTNSSLWEKLNRYQVAAPQQQLFINKLQSETGWDKNYCLLAIDEYKKFIYLACISKTPVTPSKAIDAVWHLHLTFSRSYWIDLCDNILQRPIHHDPSEENDEALMQDQYQYTLQKYANEFGVEAPVAVWQKEPEINSRKYPKLLLILGLLFGSSYVYAGLSETLENVFSLAFLIAFFWIFGYLLFGGNKGGASQRRKKKGKRKKGSSGSCGSGCGSCSSGGGSSCGGGGD